MNLIAYNFAAVPYFSTLFFILFQLDPLHVFGEVIFLRTGHKFGYVLLPCRIILLLCPLLQLCRLIPFLASTLLIYVKSVQGLTKFLKLCHFQITKSIFRSDELFNLYGTLQIISQLFYELSSVIIAVLAGSGFVNCVVFNFVSLKMYHLIPIQLYPVFPFVSLVTISIIQILVPEAIAVFENAESMIAKWRQSLALSRDLKYLKRKIRATRTVRIYAGLFSYNFFHFKMSTKGTFFSQIVSYTITALLSVETPGFS